MKQKILHYIKEIILFVLFITLFSNAVSYYKSTDLKKSSLDEQTFTLINQQIYKVKKDKPLLLHFWATWCPTCSLEASNIQELSKHYEVITIAVKSDKNEIQKYLEEKNLDFKVVNDTQGFYARKYNISAYPTTFIYSKNKELLFSEVGYTSTFGLKLRMWWSSFKE